MTIDKAIVLDANILIRAVLGQRVRDLLEQHIDSILFYAPAACVTEAQKHLPALLYKKGINPLETTNFMRHVLTMVQEVEDVVYAPFQDMALSRIAIRDPNDWPVVATALALECPIWTEDNDFFGAGVATWTTDRIHLYLSDG